MMTATASGVDSSGVGIRVRSVANLPLMRSTGAPLIPEPPISIPNACAVGIIVVVLSDRTLISKR